MLQKCEKSWDQNQKVSVGYLSALNFLKKLQYFDKFHKHLLLSWKFNILFMTLTLLRRDDFVQEWKSILNNHCLSVQKKNIFIPKIEIFHFFQFPVMHLNFLCKQSCTKNKISSKKSAGIMKRALFLCCVPTSLSVPHYQWDSEMLWLLTARATSSWKFSSPSEMKSLILSGSLSSSICSSWVRWPRMVARHRSCSDWKSRFNSPSDISAKVLHLLWVMYLYIKLRKLRWTYVVSEINVPATPIQT